MPKKVDLSEPAPTDIQYEHNHELIKNAWEEIINATGKRPTTIAIAEKTGLIRQTVSNHLKRMQFDKDVTPRHMLNLDRALDKLYDLGMGGDAKALVEFIKLVGNPSKKQEIQKSVTNKTLRVSFTGKDKDNMERTEEVEFTEVKTDEDD